jgi:hypothetical protein
MAIRSGKTTAICAAAKSIGATVVVHSMEEAKRVEQEHGVKAVPYTREIRGTRGPYLVDTHAVSMYAYEKNLEIERLEDKADRLQTLLALYKAECDLAYEMMSNGNWHGDGAVGAAYYQARDARIKAEQ